MTDPVRRPGSADEELLSAEWAAVETELTDPQRIDRIAAELEMAFRTLADVRRGITVFGSARIGEGRRERARDVDHLRCAARAELQVVTISNVVTNELIAVLPPTLP